MDPDSYVLRFQRKLDEIFELPMDAISHSKHDTSEEQEAEHDISGTAKEGGPVVAPIPVRHLDGDAVVSNPMLPESIVPHDDVKKEAIPFDNMLELPSHEGADDIATNNPLHAPVMELTRAEAPRGKRKNKAKQAPLKTDESASATAQISSNRSPQTHPAEDDWEAVV